MQRPILLLEGLRQPAAANQFPHLVRLETRTYSTEIAVTASGTKKARTLPPIAGVSRSANRSQTIIRNPNPLPKGPGKDGNDLAREIDREEERRFRAYRQASCPKGILDCETCC